MPEGTVFVMGDNRANSADSSVHLCLPDQPGCTDDPYVPVDVVRGVVDPDRSAPSSTSLPS